MPFALTPVTYALQLPQQQRGACDLSGKLQSSLETSIFCKRESLKRRAGQKEPEIGQEPARVPLTCAPSLLRCTSTAEDSWISLPSYTPQPASTTATLFPMVTTRAGGFPGEPQIAVRLCSLPGAFYSAIPPPGAGGARRVGLNFLLAGRFYFQCHRQGM